MPQIFICRLYVDMQCRRTGDVGGNIKYCTTLVHYTCQVSVCHPVSISSTVVCSRFFLAGLQQLAAY